MSNNQEKLNEQLLNVIKSKTDDIEVKVKKVKYLIRLGADVNAKFFGKSILRWLKKDEDVAPEVIEFLKEKGGEEWEISREEAYVLALRFWDKNGKIKSVEEIKSLVRCGASLSVRNKDMGKQIWRDLSLQEMNEILKMLPRGYEIGGDVVLDKCELKELPDFSKVKVRGNFCCSENQLISLKGAPKKVGGRFYCSFNQLTTLKGGPEKVGMFFQCAENKLTTLEGAPKKVGTGFDCSYNQLTTLKGAPEEVGEGFYCSNNRLISLEGKPQKIGGEFAIEEEVLDKIRSNEKAKRGEVLTKIEENKASNNKGFLGRLFGGR